MHPQTKVGRVLAEKAFEQVSHSNKIWSVLYQWDENSENESHSLADYD